METLKPKRMKKSLLFLGLFLAGIISLQAQCTITPSCTVTSGYCSAPATGSALPNATEQVAYSTTIQLSVGTSYSIATIDSAQVTSLTGLPTGLSYSTNPTSGVVQGGSNGCILIAGTPAAGSAGTYTATAAVTAYTNFGPFPGTLTWSLTVNGTSGITNLSANAENVVIAPNPAKSEVNVTADFHFQKIRVYDALGNLSLTQDVNGAYKATVDLSKLNTGIYFIQIVDGTKVATRKFIKE
jgi:hypothetical protein